ncbi:MAG: hypothetical protein H6Q90_4770 [Deltaproteobacteria bacterium]|nr:hypothetical protein [Deltaproteobacteria bacterium]
MVQPGDLVLVRSPGAIFAAGRRLTGNAYDHIAVVVQDDQTVNIDKPMSRRLPASRLLRSKLHPLVLRPAWRDEAARDGFVRWMESLVDLKYDARRTLRLLGSLALRRAGIVVPLIRPQPSARRWICTDAVLLGLERYVSDLDTRDPSLDWQSLRCGTTNDFLRLARARPDLLAQVMR